MRFVILLLLSLVLIPACAPMQVERLEPRTVTDLNGAWNDEDARQVAEMVVQDLRGVSVRGRDGAPVIIVGYLRNRGDEPISMTSMERWIETELVRGGGFRVVTSADLRGELRVERESQQAWASPATQTRLRNEMGAEYLLHGTLHTWEESERRRTVRTYRIDTYLVNLESTERIWAGSHEIKKEIRTPWFGF